MKREDARAIWIYIKQFVSVDCFINMNTGPIYCQADPPTHANEPLTPEMQERHLTKQPKHFLESHKISKKQRAKMVDWVIEVLGIFDQTPETIFRAVLLIDSYLDETEERHSIAELHLLGVSCMFTASKVEEVRPLKMRSVVEEICKFKFNRKQIAEKERLICSTLKFALNQPSLRTYGRSLLSLLDLPKKVARPIRQYALLLQKMFLYSYDILSVFTFEQLAAFSLIISLKLYEHGKRNFSAQKAIRKLLSICQIEKAQILDNLNYLRDFASDFQGAFPFNNLKVSGQK